MSTSAADCGKDVDVIGHWTANRRIYRRKL